MRKLLDWCLFTCLFMSFFHASQIHCTSQTAVPSQQEQRERDRIESLPGQPSVNLKQYGGYVNVNESTGRSLYYYFVEATNADNSSPLVLWLNGGPGCSSLGYGAFKELGPFRVHSDGKTLYANPYAWNNAANILFLESPIGTGFSYTVTKSDLENPGDSKTAADNYVFLVKWLERFPEYKGREFYIAGESYAGHYVPQLAQTILVHNNDQTSINLRGVLIGNPILDQESFKGTDEYLVSHALITQQSLLRAQECQTNSMATEDITAECIDELRKKHEALEHLNQYNILAPVCLNSTLTNEPKLEFSRNMELDPCIESYLTAYLNRVEVQGSMHVVTNTKMPYTWKMCSGANEFWNDDERSTSVLPILKELMGHENMRVWVYSGDLDAVVTVTSTMYALEKMNLTMVKEWHPWYTEGEVAGYTEEYSGNFRFLTVRGAGHEVPSYKPKSALSLFTHFIRNSPLPSTR